MTSLPGRARWVPGSGYGTGRLLGRPGAVRSDQVQDEATFESHQNSKSFELVVVNGTPVVETEKPTGALPGESSAAPGGLIQHSDIQ